MNEELTREVLEAMKKCSLSCARCDANGVCDKYNAQDTIQTLATALLEERAKPKNDVWKFAPDHATVAAVEWRTKKGKAIDTCIYTREMPETRAEEIAEEAAQLLPFACVNGNCNYVRDTIKTALTKYAEELKGEA